MVTSKAPAAIKTMATKPAKGQSMLWGSPIEFWDLWGVRLLFTGAIVGVGGLVLSALSAYVLYRVADVAQKDLSSQTAQATAELGKAQADIENSKVEIARANEGAAKANARANEAQLALEKLKAPRIIPSAEIPRLVALLSTFAGTKAAIYILGEGPEPNGLAGVVGAILKQAYWDFLSWNWSGVGAATGILVICKDGSEKQITDACDALVRAFVSVKLDVGRQQWPGDWAQVGGMLNGPNPPSPYDAPIRIIIGTKLQ
jgi:hypothetical protein